MFELLKLWRVSTHSRPKAAALHSQLSPDDCAVSTHSRPKAAAYQRVFECRPHYGFNTQPPEGGCEDNGKTRIWGFVSTHSRPKAAAPPTKRLHLIQPVSTHSRPKAAATSLSLMKRSQNCFNTQPPEGGCGSSIRTAFGDTEFQHTAARRRLQRSFSLRLKISRFNTQPPEGGCIFAQSSVRCQCGFNTQPPEGGCEDSKSNA